MNAPHRLRTFDNCLNSSLNELVDAPPQFTASTLARYLSDPEYRAELDAERVARQAEIAAEFEAHDRARQEAAWARDQIEPDTRNMITGGMA